MTYLTSQVFHDGLKVSIFNSVALVGIATVFGPSTSGTSFFIIYLIGGFIGANVDCAWTWVKSPLRRLSGVTYEEKIREGKQLELWNRFTKKVDLVKSVRDDLIKSLSGLSQHSAVSREEREART